MPARLLRVKARPSDPFVRLNSLVPVWVPW